VVKTNPENPFLRGLGIHLDLNLYIALQSQKYIIRNALEEITGEIVVEPHTLPNSVIPKSL